MIVLRLALQSLANRRLTALLALASVALSVMLLLGVEKVRHGARQSFADTISGTDLIVGARTGGVQLLLYSVFRIGNAGNEMRWSSFLDIAKQPEVAWAVPLALGDTHRGYRVLGTSSDYFKHYRYRRGRGLAFAEGQPFADLHDAVIGAEVAAALGYGIGQKLVLAHGLGAVAFVEHEHVPFRVSGILERTGTPVDRTVHVSLAAIEAMHAEAEGGGHVSRHEAEKAPSGEAAGHAAAMPETVTAALIGLKARPTVLRLQRAISTYPHEALTAIIPGATLRELWELVGVAETALAAVSWMVVATALLGLATMILTTLNERRREMAILRSVGARPTTIMGLLVAEAGLLSLAGVVLGAVMTYAGLSLLRPLVDRWYGIDLAISPPNPGEVGLLAAIVLAGMVIGLLPAWRAYRLSLADGMTVRT